ncbi:DUF3168 domain-containing protein [Chelativorans salis]|uniref:DUF3168 domain-containing protein n=1 Tax=Chelativorans salis TaxID=2978478 RepID=A0ABT2LNC1_9HYPH|nr:DUF3168 domain-containing protein [Chelativorans sp. EGI FJ00035]MCT7376065.1 DUF3168 domain-containing protein [Chelativorans sp. EGI FJ00035]
MTATTLDLQEAIFSALADDAALVATLGGALFHDLTPAGLAFPYVTFGRATAYDWSTGTEEGSEHFFTLNVWSKKKGRREVLALMELVRGALHEGELGLAGHRLVNLRLETSEVRYDEDLGAYHGGLHFRAVVEA